MPKIVVMGGSSGSIDVLKVILKGLPAHFPAPVLLVTHIGPRESILPDILGRHSALPVRHALQGEPIVAGQVLVAPPDLHLTVASENGRHYALLSHGPKENHSRPAIDPLFRSAAAACGADAIGVVLSGFLDDGTVGLQAIKAFGGVAVVQDPEEAEAPDMPASALAHASVDLVRGMDAIAPTLVELAGRPAQADLPPEANVATQARDWIAVENGILTEGSDMADLDKIGTPAPLTCPECGGALWKIRHAHPLRYRCHTGHAFTAKVLDALQSKSLEDALWAAVRALHETERLCQQLHQKTRQSRHPAHDEYLSRAEQAKQHAQLLRDLIAQRAGIVPR